MKILKLKRFIIDFLFSGVISAIFILVILPFAHREPLYFYLIIWLIVTIMSMFSRPHFWEILEK